MDVFLNLTIRLSIVSIKLLANYIIFPLVQLYIWYLIYSFALLIIKIIVKLRFEVYNESLKYKFSECSNKVLVITGATSGIGLAVTKYFHSKGFTIIACYYSKEEPGYRELEEKQKRFNDEEKSGNLFLCELNVKNLQSIEGCKKYIDEILQLNKELNFHALINVAGVGYLNKFQWQSKDKIQTTLETNLFGPIMMSREFMPLLIKNATTSRLVNVSSPLGIFSAPYNTVYGTTKSALTHFTNTLRIDAISYNLKTVTILPGNIIRNTSILNSSYESDHNSLLASLSDEEKQLYEKELNCHEILRLKMIRAKDRPLDLRLNLKAKLSRNLMKLGLIIGGAMGNEQKLEHSNLMNSFDNAIRLKDPPKELYAGNQCFEILVGACFELLCHGFLRDSSYFLARHKINALG